MSTAVVKCPKCQAPLAGDVLNTGELAPCGTCRTPIRVEIFPAFFRKVERGAEGERVMIEGEASCFYHPAKKAGRPCESCGRFMCALCDCELRGQHFCPSCLEAGRKKGKIKSLENRRVLYDSIALSLVIIPWAVVVFYFVSIVTAPAALFIAVRNWNAPRGIVRRTKARLIIAIILATLQIAFWIFVIVSIISARSRNG